MFRCSNDHPSITELKSFASLSNRCSVTGSIRINDSCVISMTINLSGSRSHVLPDLHGETWSPKRGCAHQRTPTHPPLRRL